MLAIADHHLFPLGQNFPNQDPGRNKEGEKRHEAHLLPGKVVAIRCNLHQIIILYQTLILHTTSLSSLPPLSPPQHLFPRHGRAGRDWWGCGSGSHRREPATKRTEALRACSSFASREGSPWPAPPSTQKSSTLANRLLHFTESE